MPSPEEMAKLAEKMPGGDCRANMPGLPPNFPGAPGGLPGLGGKLPGLGGLPGLGKEEMTTRTFEL